MNISQRYDNICHTLCKVNLTLLIQSYTEKIVKIYSFVPKHVPQTKKPMQINDLHGLMVGDEGLEPPTPSV